MRGQTKNAAIDMDRSNGGIPGQQVG